MKPKQFRIETESHGEVIIKSEGKKGIYRVSFQHHGKHIKRSLKTSKKNVAIERLPVLLAGYPSNSGCDLEAITFDTALDYYVQSLEAKRKPKKTISQAKLRCNAFFNHLQSKRVTSFEKIKAVHADTFYRHVQSDKSDSTAFGYFRMVKAMLNYLESRELIDRNPFFRVKYPRPEFQHSAIPNLEQVDRILGNVESKFLVHISAVAYTGCRREALTRILDTDVDLLQSYDRPTSKWFFCSPKTSRSPGGKKLDGDDLNEAFKKAVRKSGYTAGRKNGGFTLHCLRGFFKTHALMCGVPREIIDFIQGHKSDRSVGTRHYLQFTPEDLDRYMQMINFDSQKGE